MAKPAPQQTISGRDDVVWLYKRFLDRAPENEAVIEARLGRPMREAVEDFLNSDEYRRNALRELLEHSRRNPSQSNVDLTASLEDRNRLVEHARATWARFGEHDAFWSVLTDDAYRAEALDDEARAAFFATGAEEVELFLEQCQRAGVDPRLDGRVMDFGCGVGRLGVHLARSYQAYLGVDISAPHLRDARLAVEGIAGSSHVDFQLLPEWLEGVDRYDAAFSVIVLQHNPPPLIVELTRAILSRLNPGGVAWLQIPHTLYEYDYTVAGHLAQIEAGTEEMEMHFLPQAEMFRLIEETGCRLRGALADGRAGTAGLSTTYLIVRPEEV